MFKSLTRDIFLALQARSGVSPATLVWGAVMVLASMTTFVFLCIALYGWLSLQLGAINASLAAAGIFIVIAAFGAIICALIRRRVRERAIIERTAPSQGVEIKLVAKDTNHPNEVEGASQFLAEQKADVVIVLQTSMLISQTRPIAESAVAKRLPTVYGYREHVVDGGLISYGVDLRWCYQRAAAFVVKILHGSAPGDLPVEFPTSVLLSINLRTAKLLGLRVPPGLLARADEVIE